jgi:predicted MPP superfamily phosphohydrolase
MIPLLSWDATLALFGVGVGVAAVGTSLFDLKLWKSRRFMGAAGALTSPIALGLVLWRADSPRLAALGVDLAWFFLPLLLLGGFALVLSAPLHRLLGWWARHHERHDRSARAGARRRFLRQTAAALPAGAVAIGTAALTGNDTTRIVEVPFKFRGLAPELHGLRILQLSDLHLGAGRTSRDLHDLLEGLRAHPPDLIVLTGDVADQLEELVAGLDIVTAFAPRLGVYAALGNHEYLNGIERMLPAYQASSVRLLINETAAISLGSATLFLAGVDDPVFIGPPKPFFEQAVADCAANAPSDAFRLLLCHRPEGFEAASRHGFHLTLSGHTHGGQVGLLGRSAFEVLFGMPYLWGAYRRGESRLYTTSGFGHWFPFRLNCPAEAPLIVLERA